MDATLLRYVDLDRSTSFCIHRTLRLRSRHLHVWRRRRIGWSGGGGLPVPPRCCRKDACVQLLPEPVDCFCLVSFTARSDRPLQIESRVPRDTTWVFSSIWNTRMLPPCPHRDCEDSLNVHQTPQLARSFLLRRSSLPPRRRLIYNLMKHGRV